MLLLACATPPEPPPAAPPLALDVVDDATFATAWSLQAGTLRVAREVRPDPGRFLDGEWVSESAADPVFSEGSPISGPVLLRWHDTLTVRRACGDSVVPVTLDATPVVSLAYPVCGARPESLAATVGELRVLQSLGLFTDVPIAGADDEPAGYFTTSEARDWCAWWGGALLAAAPSNGPGSWLADGSAWSDGPLDVPPGARMPGVGARCGFAN